jgi:uncharacterized protein (AIM24 family)
MVDPGGRVSLKLLLCLNEEKSFKTEPDVDCTIEVFNNFCLIRIMERRENQPEGQGAIDRMFNAVEGRGHPMWDVSGRSLGRIAKSISSAIHLSHFAEPSLSEGLRVDTRRFLALPNQVSMPIRQPRPQSGNKIGKRSSI